VSDVKHLHRFSSCFDALFGPKTVSHFSENALDQDDFWLNQPKVKNLIDSKVIEQHGFK